MPTKKGQLPSNEKAYVRSKILMDYLIIFKYVDRKLYAHIVLMVLFMQIKDNNIHLSIY